MKRIFLVALVMLLLPTVASAQWNVQPGYRSFYDLGVGIGTGDESKTNFEVSTSQGYQLVPTFSISAREQLFRPSSTLTEPAVSQYS